MSESIAGLLSLLSRLWSTSLEELGDVQDVGGYFLELIVAGSVVAGVGVCTIAWWQWTLTLQVRCYAWSMLHWRLAYCLAML